MGASGSVGSGDDDGGVAAAGAHAKEVAMAEEARRLARIQKRNQRELASLIASELKGAEARKIADVKDREDDGRVSGWARGCVCVCVGGRDGGAPRGSTTARSLRRPYCTFAIPFTTASAGPHAHVRARALS